MLIACGALEQPSLNKTLPVSPQEESTEGVGALSVDDPRSQPQTDHEDGFFQGSLQDTGRVEMAEMADVEGVGEDDLLGTASKSAASAGFDTSELREFLLKHDAQFIPGRSMIRRIYIVRYVFWEMVSVTPAHQSRQTTKSATSFPNTACLNHPNLRACLSGVW
ncbi:unnamed protein product [Clonostachys byssicola]|uniref:Uncharacterized protein n=1 Tax=Clonostachys byssicola TaxID=160290 RepID=A0A9N9ULY0_9HYPO|nr:unnamed protein product [Clonostachys byssicola]